MSDSIIIQNARQNNLKNISVSIPKRKLTAVIGVSGSGKTSLAYDVIFAEAYSRYIETLDPSIRKKIDHMERPDVDVIKGLSPAAALDQESGYYSPLSTVGTLTEIAYYIQLLFSKKGQPYCPQCLEPVQSLNPKQMANLLEKHASGKHVEILADIEKSSRETSKQFLSRINSYGFDYIYINERRFNMLEDDHNLHIDNDDVIFGVVDTIKIEISSRKQLIKTLQKAARQGSGYIKLIIDNGKIVLHPYTCSHHSVYHCDMWDMMFSSNSIHGKCPDCNGLGRGKMVSEHALIKDENLSINEGAFLSQVYNPKGRNLINMIMYGLAEKYDVDLNKPYKDLIELQKNVILYGTGGSPFPLRRPEYLTIRMMDDGRMTVFEGLVNMLQREYNRLVDSEEKSVIQEQFFKKITDYKVCETCSGQKYKKRRLLVKLNGLSIYEVGQLQLTELLRYLQKIHKDAKNDKYVYTLAAEAISRTKLFIEIGLGYLSLNQECRTLSKGELQRIRIINRVTSGMAGMLYVVDEPSIGLHDRDCNLITDIFRKLINLGNTIIMVDHNKKIIKQADHIIEMGPGGGTNGGKVIAEGTLSEIIESKTSRMGVYLKTDGLYGKRNIKNDNSFRTDQNNCLKIVNAYENNLKHINVQIPFGALVALTGVSGSGKSTLIRDVILRYYDKMTSNKHIDVKVDRIDGFEKVDKLIYVNQVTFNNTETSNVATYIDIYTSIRRKFAETKQAIDKGFTISDFTLCSNESSRCTDCNGTGKIQIEMAFSSPKMITCPVCHGRKFIPSVLDILYKDKSIYDVLNMTIDTAAEFFADDADIVRKLNLLKDVGLGYLVLGQLIITLSGGEAQRMKLARGLASLKTDKKKKHCLFILDEPTAGMHIEDTQKIYECFRQMVGNGHSVLIVEHNLDIIAQSDFIIDLGPDGGNAGGNIVGYGTPYELASAKESKSYTGAALRRYLDENYPENTDKEI